MVATVETFITKTYLGHGILIYTHYLRNLFYSLTHTSRFLIPVLGYAHPDVPELPDPDKPAPFSFFVSLCKFVGKYVDARDHDVLVPALFCALIDAATSSRAAFQRIMADTLMTDVDATDADYESFIETLRECFRILCGADAHQKSSVLVPARPLTQSELDRLIIKEFPRLKNKESETVHEPEASPQVAPPAGHQRKQARPGKGKKSRRRKDSEASKSKDTNAAKEAFEKFSEKVLQDVIGIELPDNVHPAVTFMTVFDWFKECFDLRAYLQSVWYDVAYKGLNSAVAGTLWKIALRAMNVQPDIKSVKSTLAHDVSYREVMVIMYGVLGFGAELEDMDANKGDERLVNGREMFLVYTYRDLLDFITDYKKNSTGKPTKRMMKEINNWDPHFDLRSATMEERLKWRRSYTINMLYDLVGLCAHRMEKIKEIENRKTLDPAKRLAVDKSDKNVRDQICPIHVFYLQMIVDSFTVTKGWTFDLHEGHRFNEPANGFHPMRDNNTFFGGINQPNSGILYAVGQLSQRLQAQSLDIPQHSNIARSRHVLDLVNITTSKFQEFFVPSDLLERSRFRLANPSSPSSFQGLWEFSPLLCSAGLAEVLESGFLLGLHIWGHHFEPIILMHLYNMLLREGYLKAPIQLFENMQRLFPLAFFPHGTVPVSDYATVLAHRVAELEGAMLNKHAKNSGPGALSEPYYLTIAHDSMLILLQATKWSIDKISSSVVPLSSLVAKLRIARTEQIVDPNTGTRRLQETVLVKRAKAALISEGLSESSANEKLLAVADAVAELDAMEKEQAGSSVDKVHCMTPDHYSSSDALDLIKVDLMADVDGERPVCGVNLLAFTNYAFEVFEAMEVMLTDSRNKTLALLVTPEGHYKVPRNRQLTTNVQSYGRSLLVVDAIRNNDAQVLKRAAHCIKKFQIPFSNCILWKKLKFGDGESTSPQTTATAARTPEKEDNDVQMHQCSVIKGVVLDEGTVLLRPSPKELKSGDEESLPQTTGGQWS
ncbi:hypothetical protein B0T20DRAFT_455916 [Sordaria brevicollis]|uniref:DUF6604 domain-containing protein n=1 Tax=Sordaria brevicollis TaxID=83679 RepID=A0AAE0U660_SORBR|nr:hypothetical protein B0T20DRAFT_455916 [Sordaria brevicollis]